MSLRRTMLSSSLPARRRIVASAAAAALAVSFSAVSASRAAAETERESSGSGLIGTGPTSGGITLDLPGVDRGDVVDADMSGYRGAALDSRGQVLSWGNGVHADEVETSDTAEMRRVDMSRVASGERIVQVVAGRDASYAVGSTGAVYAWGANSAGELGQGDTAPRDGVVAIPRDAFGGEAVTRVVASAENQQAAALTASGRVFVWGVVDRETSCLVDDGRRGTVDAPAPLAMGGLTGQAATGLFGGPRNLYLTAEDGSVWGCGANESWQLADGTRTHRPTPVRLDFDPLPGGVVQIASSGWRSQGIVGGDGSLWLWGLGNAGVLANGGETDEPLPRRVDTGTAGHIAQIAIGARVASAVTSDGRLFTWGASENGGLGNGTTTGTQNVWSLQPISIPDAGGAAALAVTGSSPAESHHARLGVITDDGQLRTWGRSGDLLGPAGTRDLLRPTAFEHIDRVFFGSTEAVAVSTGSDPGLWRVTVPAHAPGIVDLTAWRGPWSSVLPSAFRFGVPLAPEVVEHPAGMSALLVGQTVTLTSSARGNDVPSVEWQWAPRGSLDWRPFGDPAVETSVEADGEVALVTSSLAIVVTDEPRLIRAVWRNDAGEAASDAGWVSAAFIRPMNLVSTPRTMLVDALP